MLAPMPLNAAKLDGVIDSDDRRGVGAGPWLPPGAGVPPPGGGDSCFGVAVVNVRSALLLVPSAFVATTWAWYVVAGVRPESATVTGVAPAPAATVGAVAVAP